MPTLVPLQSIIVRRRGDRVIPPVGLAYEFSDEEAKDLGPDVVRPAHSGDKPGLATRALDGIAVKAASGKQKEVLATLAKATEALADVAIQMRSERGTAAVIETAPARPARGKAAAKPAAEEGDDL